jgi:hypothetical protein
MWWTCTLQGYFNFAFYNSSNALISMVLGFWGTPCIYQNIYGILYTCIGRRSWLQKQILSYTSVLQLAFPYLYIPRLIFSILVYQSTVKSPQYNKKTGLTVTCTRLTHQANSTSFACDNEAIFDSNMT